MADNVVSLMPDHRVYVEPFAGSLAVLLAKAKVSHEVVNDLDGDVVNFWRVLRDCPDELSRVCRDTPYARWEYEHAAAVNLAGVTDRLERARLWWVRISQAHGHCVGAGWSTGNTRSQSRAATCTNHATRIPAVADRLRDVVLENRTALEMIPAYDADDAVIYVDPPYPAEARNSTGYAYEMPSADDHRRLAKILHACAGTVLLSGYACPLYDELYGGWDCWTFDSRVGNGGRRDGREYGTECVWVNRETTRQETLL